MKIHSHSSTDKEGEGGGAYIGAGVTVHSAHACAQYKQLSVAAAIFCP